MTDTDPVVGELWLEEGTRVVHLSDLDIDTQTRLESIADLEAINAQHRELVHQLRTDNELLWACVKAADEWLAGGAENTPLEYFYARGRLSEATA